MKGNIFNTVEMTAPGKNKFNLSHDVKLSCKMGELIPIMVSECIPGDAWKIGAEALIRFAPLVAPVMHRMDVSIHYFFVPNRIVWPNWESFITDPYQNNPPVAPFISFADFDLSPSEARHADYMGVPPVGAAYHNLNAIPFAAYNKIYNEYYRDQNLITPCDDELIDGQQTQTDFLITRKRAWEHDYFTAALPFAQKGASVDIPLGDVQLKNQWANFGQPFIADASGSGANFPDEYVMTQAVGSNVGMITRPFGGAATYSAYDPDGTLQVEATTITDLRRAFKLQEWLEKNARAGTRYTENILAHFGVKSSDARLQRPEYITGVKSPIVISEIVNTTGEVDGLPQGNLAGHGIGVAAGRFGSYFCEEHGYIIGIMSIMPKTAYQQGVPKHYLKRDPLDYYWPSFAHIGEQEVKNIEIYAPGNNDQGTFGYVPRYAEYKFVPNRVAGDFRTTLDFWHLGRIFSAAPALNQAFIECVPDTRIFAVEDGTDYLWCHVLNKVSAIRAMPKFGNPYM